MMNLFEEWRNDENEVIRVNKEVQKSINVIMVVDGNNLHDFGI